MRTPRTICSWLLAATAGCSLALDDLSTSAPTTEPTPTEAPTSTGQKADAVVEVVEVLRDAGREGDEGGQSADADPDATTFEKCIPGSTDPLVAAAASTTTADAGATPWTSILEARNPDSKRASCSLPARGRSQALELTDYAANVPTGAKITGISVEVIRHSTGRFVSDRTVELFAGSTRSANERADEFWPLSSSTKTYGGASELWNVAWTQEQVTSSTFGVRIVVNGDISDPATASVDSVRVVVHYCE